MKKTIIIMVLMACFVFDFTAFSATRRAHYEIYDVWEVGQIIPLRDCDISYTILSNNGVAEYIQDGEFKGGIVFKKTGNASADLLSQVEDERGIFRFNYHIVPKGSVDFYKLIEHNSVNQARVFYGLNYLQLSDDLNKCCDIRARELAYYYSHQRPDGSQYSSIVDNKGSFLAENIGVIAEGKADISSGDISDTVSVMGSYDWNKLDETRTNMLNPSFKETGVGYYYDALTKYYYWVQIFRG